MERIFNQMVQYPEFNKQRLEESEEKREREREKIKLGERKNGA